MNFIKRWILRKLELICPKCDGKLRIWRGCSHNPMREYCENENCDYTKVYEGEAASGLSMPLWILCPKCGEMLMEFWHAGIKEIRCDKCNTVFIPEDGDKGHDVT